jgi:hypothetical protein
VAPKFNLVSKPNDWSRSVRSSAAKATELSDVRKTQLEFWTGFKDYMEEHSTIRCHKPAPQHWMNHSIGRSGFGLTSIASTWNSETQTYNPELRAEFYVSLPEAREYFEILETQKAEIEAETGQPLIWSSAPGKKICRAYVRRSTDFQDRSQWPQQHEWLRENLERLRRVFATRVRQLDLSKTAASHQGPLADARDNSIESPDRSAVDNQ